MRKTTLIFLTVLFCGTLYAQNDTTEAPKTWRWSGLYSAALTQTSLTNWAAGGNNNVNISGLVKQLAIMKKNRWQWNNLLELNFGYNFQPGLNNKTDDRLEFTTRVDRNVAKDLDISLFANLRTQMADGFTNPGDPDSLRISTFMAPAYLTYGLGLTYKGVSGLSVYVSPATIKQTFVLDSTLAVNDVFFDNESPNVGVLADGVYRSEFGAYIDIIYAKAFSESFELNSKLNLFSNYLDRPQNIDVNWETILLLKVYSYLSVSLQLHLIYDHDIIVQDTNGDGVLNAPGTQFKQILGVGLAYSFGEFKK